jgi:hypothetical protein
VGYLLAGNRAMVMKQLQEGLATPEYEAFTETVSGMSAANSRNPVTG